MNEETNVPKEVFVKLTKPCKLLEQAWKIYVDKFWLFIKVFLYTLLGMIPLVVTIIIFISADIVKLPENVTSMINVLVILAGLASLFFAIYYSLRSKAGMFLVCETDKTVSAKEVFSKTKHLVWPYFIVTLVSGILVLLWSILFIIPGIIFAIYYTFSALIVIYENKKPWQSIQESKALVKNYWWATFGRLFFIGVIISIISFGLTLIGDQMPEKSLYFAVWNVLTQILMVIISPIFIVYSYLLYKNLKEVKKA